MLRRIALALSVSALGLSDPAYAQPQATPVNLATRPLAERLQELQRQTGIEILFDPALVRGLNAAPISPDLALEDALRRLVDGTNLTVRRAASGAWIVEAQVTTPLEQQDAAAPEIIVIGRRTQNADIRRFENDVQPYVVVTQQELRSAHRDSIDQYFASRITPNTTVVPPYLANGANVWSEFDLRGMGADNTLVLVDGRRMPELPASSGVDQSDVNGIPMHAIERIEVLTGAASGIHGYGALGGVVNVVLDRDGRGLEVFATGGISSQGDAERRVIEMSYGATSADNRTDFMIFAAHSDTDDLRAGDRDFVENDRRQTREAAPDFYDILGARFGNSLTIQNLLGTNLQLRPEFGGGTLPSPFTYLPAGFSGDPTQLAGLLSANAGQIDFSLSRPDADTDIVPRMRSDALLLNVRHRFAAGIEIYADAVMLRSRGEHDDWRDELGGTAFISPDSPVNPFTDFIVVYFPLEGMNFRVTKEIENTRYTIGALSNLPFGWRGTFEASLGELRYDSSVRSAFSLNSFLFLSGDPSDLDTNPFGNWDAFQSIFNSDPSTLTADLEARTLFSNQSARLAGPAFRTNAGAATLTLLAEHRRDEIPEHTLYQTDAIFGPPVAFASRQPSSTSDTLSFHAELRAPIYGETAPLLFLRGLETQLAFRFDELTGEFQRYLGSDNNERMQVRFTGVNYTFGFKVTPLSWLMVRASFATGEHPPNLDLLRESEPETTTLPFTTDPLRGDTPLNTALFLRTGGNPGLEAMSADTIFLGAVITPLGEDGPRFAIDYSRIERDGDIIEIFPEEFLANESIWPDRVERGPLTAEDLSLGYSAGPVIALDARSMNAGSVESETVDLRAEWPIFIGNGRLRFYGDATYQLRNFHVPLLSQANDHAGRFLGPLKWRANAGVEWSNADLTLGANVQYFSEYSIMFAGEVAPTIDTIMQGAEHVDSQTYLDLYAGWRLPLGPGRDVSLELGVNNVLDAAPPRETTFGSYATPSYSRYGDPRQRRFELVLSSMF